MGSLITLTLVAAMTLQRAFGTKPYCWMFSFWKRGLQSGWLQRQLAKRRPYFSEFLDITGYTEGDRHALLASHYLLDLMRGGARSPTFSPTIRKFFASAGTVSSGSPPHAALIVMAHQAQTFLAVQTAFSDDPLFMVGLKVKAGSHERITDEEYSARVTRQMLDANRLLRNEKQAGILGDGFHGKQTVELPVCGVKRPFQKGFAMLALQSNAPVIFMQTRLADDGLLNIEYSAALETLDGAKSHDEIARYLEWYAGNLERLYHEFPESIMTKHIFAFLQFVETAQ